jgi:hypothetical protein
LEVQAEVQVEEFHPQTLHFREDQVVDQMR